MSDKTLYEAYQKASETVGEISQLILLYEGAINFIEQAKEAIHENNHEKRYNLINKAISIVTGLNSCLNFNEQTGEVAKALDQYYQAIDMRLLYIQCNNSIQSCDEVIEDLRVMLNAWKDVLQQTNAQKQEGAENPALKPSGSSPNDEHPKDIEITA
jgi:flagellar protein FliS